MRRPSRPRLQRRPEADRPALLHERHCTELCCVRWQKVTATTSVAEPRAEKRPHSTTHHGVTLTDDYAWLRADNWREVMRDPHALDPAIRSHLEAENGYAAALLADTEALQGRLFAEMKGRIKEDDSSVPSVDGRFAYFGRYREGGQHRLICREPRQGGKEQVVVDGDALAQGKAYFQLGATRHSPNHRLLAWICDDAGSEYFTARVRDTESLADIADIVPDVGGPVVWTADAAAFYYVWLDEQHRPSRGYRHPIGTPTSDDKLIYESNEPGFFVSLSQVQSARFAEISLHDHETSETWLLELGDPDATATLVAARETGVRYEVEHHPDFRGGPALIMRTNAGGAEDFKIVWTPQATPGRANWQDLVPHRPGIFILSFAVLLDWLVRLEREDGLPRIVARRLTTGEEHTIAFEEEAYSLGMDWGYEFA